jgi:hypothetical protein
MHFRAVSCVFGQDAMLCLLQTRQRDLPALLEVGQKNFTM